MNLSPEGAVKWVEGNPLIAGGAIFVVGLGVLWVTGFFGGGSSSSGGSNIDPGVSAYYNAVNADDQANAAEVISQQNNAAATAQEQIAADAYTANQTLWANTSLAITNSNNAAATSALPYAEEAEIVSTLGQIASLPGTTTATKSGGFLGIGSSSSVTTTPNPAAVNAANGLFAYLDGHNPMN